MEQPVKMDDLGYFTADPKQKWMKTRGVPRIWTDYGKGIESSLIYQFHMVICHRYVSLPDSMVLGFFTW